MKSVFKRSFISMLKSPLFYLAIIIIAAGLLSDVAPYLAVGNIKVEDEVMDEEKYSTELDILRGYIPTPYNEMYEKGLNMIYIVLTDYEGIDPAIAKEQIRLMKEKNSSIDEITEYMENEYDRGDVRFYFKDYSNKKVTQAELSAYIQEKCEMENYSEFFGRKYIDFMGLYVIFACIILFTVLYFREMKKDIYELLHTKPISGRDYIGGKVLSGFLAIGSIIVVITIVFDILLFINGRKSGLPVNLLDIWKNVALYVLPNILLVISLYTALTMILKNPVAPMPILILYLIYSNMGTVNAVGEFNYRVKPMSLLIRVPGPFFETRIGDTIIYSQLALILLSIVLIFISIGVWERRKLL